MLSGLNKAASARHAPPRLARPRFDATAHIVVPMASCQGDDRTRPRTRGCDAVGPGSPVEEVLDVLGVVAQTRAGCGLGGLGRPGGAERFVRTALRALAPRGAATTPA